jgi:hypothetical protein
MNERINGMTNPFPPPLPSEFPTSSLDAIGSAKIPMPLIYEESVRPIEYYVLSLYSPMALELEEKLNDASRDGWSLFQIIRQEEDLLLVFFRQSRRNEEENR